MFIKGFTSPSPIHVYCTVTPTKRNGLTEPITHRVGGCRDESQIAKIVTDDLRAMTNTFGGLIESAGTQGRTYRAFRATWIELTI